MAAQWKGVGWGALPASPGLLASSTAASSARQAAESWTHHLHLHSPELFCKAGGVGASAKPDRSPRHPLFSNLQVFPCSLHAPSQG